MALLNRREIAAFNRKLRSVTPEIVAARFLTWYPVEGMAAARVRAILEHDLPLPASRGFKHYRNVLGILEAKGKNRRTRRKERFHGESETA